MQVCSIVFRKQFSTPTVLLVTGPALFLTDGKSYKALVNVEADLSEEGKMLVTPGDPNNSFILDILSENITRHDHSDILSAVPIKISLLESWIEGGAKE